VQQLDVRFREQVGGAGMKKICAFILSVLMFFAVNLPILAQTVEEKDIQDQDIVEYSVKKLERPKKKYFYGFNYYSVNIKNNNQNPIEITNIQYPQEFKDYFEREFNRRKASIGKSVDGNSKLLLCSPVFVVLGVITIVPTSLLALIGAPSTKPDSLDRGFLLALPMMSLFGIFSPVIFTGLTVYNLSDYLPLKKAYKNLNTNYYVKKLNQKLIIAPGESINIYLLGGVYYRGHTDVNIEIKDVKIEKTYTEAIVLKHR